MTEHEEKPSYFQPASFLPDTPIIPFGGQELKAWSSKGFPHAVRAANIAMAIVSFLPIGMITYEYLADQPALGEIGYTDVSIGAICLWLFFWKTVVLQKNVYKNRVTSVGGQANYWADIPENLDVFFKWLVGVSLFIVVCMIAVMPAGIWLLAGPGGVALLASKSLIKWKRKIYYTDFTWEEIDWIIIDRKQNLVVFTSHWDPTRTFEEQYVYFQAFIPKDQMDELVQIAKYHASTRTHFEQCHWDGCNE